MKGKSKPTAKLESQCTLPPTMKAEDREDCRKISVMSSAGMGPAGRESCTREAEQPGQGPGAPAGCKVGVTRLQDPWSCAETVREGQKQAFSTTRPIDGHDVPKRGP